MFTQNDKYRFKSGVYFGRPMNIKCFILSHTPKHTQIYKILYDTLTFCVINLRHVWRYDRGIVVSGNKGDSHRPKITLAKIAPCTLPSFTRNRMKSNLIRHGMDFFSIIGKHFQNFVMCVRKFRRKRVGAVIR